MWARWALAALIVALAAMPVVLRYLVFWPLDQWQVDVEVYRQAGESILTGRPIYLAMTEAPQLLPFTYPPFAAILSLPLALVPFGMAGWAWTLAQVLATTAITWYAARPLLIRFGPWLPVALAVLAAPMLWLHPVSDGIRFGQVNAFLVLACLMDLVRPRPRLLARVPAGVLVGLAMAIKLTPGVFVIHFLVCRRFKEAATAVATAVVVTLATWLVLPQASFAFWVGRCRIRRALGPTRAPRTRRSVASCCASARTVSSARRSGSSWPGRSRCWASGWPAGSTSPERRWPRWRPSGSSPA